MDDNRTVASAIAAFGMLLAGSVLLAAWMLSETTTREVPAIAGGVLLFVGSLFAVDIALDRARGPKG